MADLKSPEFLPPAVPTTAPQPKPRPVPKKVRQAIELLVNGDCRSITSAAKKVGWQRETLSRAFARVECREALRERAARAVAMGAGRAAARLNELIESASAKVSMDAVKFSLQTAGIGPAPGASVNVDIQIKAGYVIDLTGRKPRTEQIIEPKIVEGAGTMIDGEAGRLIRINRVE
jgi:hypothetical protein